MKKEEKIEQDQDQQDKKLLGLWPMAADKTICASKPNYLLFRVI